MERNGAEILVDFLQRQGVEVVAGMPGGAVLPVYDALGRSPIRHVLVRHEQAAGFIAQGMARACGQPGVCLATSGPGATNLVTALADARMDSVPIVAITGQVPTALLGTDAFQEVDAVAVCAPVVKHAVMVRRVEDLEAELQRAFAIAVEGRPGPVLIDLPKDVQLARLPRAEQAAVQRPPAQPVAAPLPDALDAIEALLQQSARPVLYVGGGVTQAGGHRALAALAHRQQIPVASSLMGLGCFDPDDPLWLGMLGMHGAPHTNLVMREADLLLAVGVRFDDRATGRMSEFCPHARVVHADIDPREVGKLRAVDVAAVCDARALLEALAQQLPARRRPPWRARVQALRERHPMPPAHGGARAVLDAVARWLPASATVTTDVGQHQMWAAQQLPFRRPRQLLTSGGLGTMGFGLPAAIGAALATGEPALCVTGDGSLMLCIHELSTLAELDLDVCVLVLDNGHLGLVRQQQTLFYGDRRVAARFERGPDLVAAARALGVHACTLDGATDPLGRLAQGLRRSGPRLIHVPIDAAELVLPMVRPGGGNHEMVLQPPAEAAAAAGTQSANSNG